MKDLIFLSMVRWETIRQRPQHLALELSKYYRVLYVDPIAYSFMGTLKNHLFGDRTRNILPILQKINKNLMVYTPLPMIPFSEDYWIINEWNHKLLWQALSKLLKKYQFHTPILYLNNPYQTPILKYFPASLKCYDCMDQYEAFFEPHSRRKAILIRKEKELLSRTQIVFATSEKLAERISLINNNVHLVRNAVADAFLDEPNDPISSPSDFPTGNGPVIGYVGAISHWLDLDIFKFLAVRHPEWRFILIGPIHTDISPLKDLRNVYLLGTKAHNLLPFYIKKLDIATIPFKINLLTEAVNPVKIYEYFAFGKIVVASRLPELLKFEDICYLADDTSEFVSKVEMAVEALHENSASDETKLQGMRKNIARNNTWQQRAEMIYSSINEKQVSIKQISTNQ